MKVVVLILFMIIFSFTLPLGIYFIILFAQSDGDTLPTDVNFIDGSNCSDRIRWSPTNM